MNKRVYLIAFAAAAGMTLIIWGVAKLTMKDAPISYYQHRPRVICHLKQDLHYTSEKVCIYDCDNGQKSKTEGVKTCLERLELD